MTEFKPGDLVAFRANTLVSWGIRLATFGSISHVGIVGELDDRTVLFESVGKDDLPCLIQGTVTTGVKCTSIDDRLRSDCRAFHHPLYRELYDHERQRLNEFLHAQVSKPYDFDAWRSGGLFLIPLLLGKSSHDAFWCSELCAAAHATIGIFPTTLTGRWNPIKFVRAERALGLIHKPIEITSSPTEK